MTNAHRLTLIKVVHTAVWLFFNVVIGYSVYAVIVNRMDHWLWACLAMIFLECTVLVIFRMMCPLTLIARRYSASQEANFDIYLPHWLARYNKHIYGTILGIILLLLVWRLVSAA